MAQPERRREHRADGTYEVTIGVVSERKLSTASAAAELVEQTLRARLDEIFARRGTHDANNLLRELANAIIERLNGARLISAD